MKVDIYTDGSHLDKQHGGRLGCGGVMIDADEKILAEFSQELSPDYMKITFGADTCSNPTAEMVGILMALFRFEKELKGKSEIIIHSDYMGCQEWMAGRWKIKEPYIQRIKDDIDSEIARQGLKGKIKFVWVKGHQRGDSKDARWNNYVDERAKGNEKL